MRLLYYHQYFSTPNGAGGLRAWENARALSNAGHDVHVVCASSSRHSSGLEGDFVDGMRCGLVGGLSVTEFQLGYSNHLGLAKRAHSFLRFAWRGVRLAMKEPPDLIFASSTPLTAALPGIVAARLQGTAFVFEVRDLWPDLPKAMGVIKNPVVLFAMSLLERLAYRSADACIGLSPGMVRGIRERSPPGRVVKLLPNACDLELFACGNARQRAPDAIADDEFVAMFTGAHGRANGLDAVLDVAAELKRRRVSGLRLVFVGEGSEKARLRARATDEQLDSCLFLDPVPKAQLPHTLARADVALMILDDIPAFYEGTSPNKFFDYLAAGRPVLTNLPGWVAGMIERHALGASVPPGDAHAFADALLALRADKHGLAEHGKRARQLAETEFDRTKLATRVVALVESVHERKRG